MFHSLEYLLSVVKGKQLGSIMFYYKTYTYPYYLYRYYDTKKEHTP